MLLSISSDSKTVKGEKYGYLTGVLYLAPSDVSGRNTCPMASAGCRSACLYTAGRGRFSNVQQSRIDKTLRYFADVDAFTAELRKDIEKLERKAKKLGLIPAVRLNGTSDLFGRMHVELITAFPHITFYDYTKVSKRFNIAEKVSNYSLTFSRSESNELEALGVLERGHNIAVVFAVDACGRLPILYHGFPVIDGDESDLRFLDARGVVVGLKAKGDAKRDRSGFVVQTTDPNAVYFPV
jgi:hypothetical protein